MSWEDIIGHVFMTAVGLAFLGLVIFCMVAVYGAVQSNGQVDYCYVQMWSPNQLAPQWQLTGHRPWREDRVMGVYNDLIKAKEAADLVNCKIEAK